MKPPRPKSNPEVIRRRKRIGLVLSASEEQRLRDGLACGYTVTQMAVILHRKREFVEQEMQRLGLKALKSIPKPAPKPVATTQQGWPAHGGGTIVDHAERILAKRLVKKNGARLLDGSKCDLDRLMLEANKILKACGMEQLGKNPNWLV